MAIPSILKTMMENRKINNLASNVQTMSMSGLPKVSVPGSHSFKKKIIEDTPKHKVLIEHFEAIVERCSNENDSCSEDE